MTHANTLHCAHRSVEILLEHSGECSKIGLVPSLFIPTTFPRETGGHTGDRPPPGEKIQGRRAGARSASSTTAHTSCAERERGTATRKSARPPPQGREGTGSCVKAGSRRHVRGRGCVVARAGQRDLARSARRDGGRCHLPMQTSPRGVIVRVSRRACAHARRDVGAAATPRTCAAGPGPGARPGPHLHHTTPRGPRPDDGASHGATEHLSRVRGTSRTLSDISRCLHGAYVRDTVRTTGMVTPRNH